MASRSNAPEGRESSPKATPPPTARQFLGKYELQRRIGSGGMGSVFLAFDGELKRTVALKVLPKEKAQNAVLVKRFKAEAQAAAHLRHENIVAVYDAGEADGYLYIALEYVDGTDLQNLVNKRGPLPVKRSIEIVKQVARALQHAHERNIVHRDIKPSNMLIASDGRMKLTDMGLARSVDETTETDITRAGTTVGTVDYMSPEQARNSRAADIRSDIYSLGCAWYQMLTGKPPFPDGSVTNKLHAHATQPPPDPREINSEVPEALVAVLHRMMAKSADKRYQTPQELLKDLENTYISREGVSAAVLAALAEDEAPRRPGGGGASAAAPPVLPPKGAPRRKQETAEKEGRNLEPLKYLAIAAAVVGLIGFLYWISTGLSSVFDSSPNANDNPFAAGETESGGDVNAVQAVPPGSVKAKKFEPREKSKQGPAIIKAVDTIPSADPPPAGKAGPASSSQQASRAYEESRLPDWLRKLAPPDEGSTPKGSAAKGKGSAVRPPADLPVLTVGRVGDGPSSKFATLTAALAQVPDGGGMVQLVGDGPFVLTPTRLKKRRVVIAGAPGSRPVVLLVAEAGERGAEGALLSLSDGSLALIDVHLVAVADQLPPEGNVSLVEVAGGDLAVLRSSATLIGTRPGSTAAFRIAGASVPLNAATPRGVIARTLVRGRGLTAVDIDAARVEFAASRSLFVVDQGPVLRVTNTGPSIGGIAAGPATGAGAASGGTEQGNQAPERMLELVGCTVVSGGTAFALEAGRAEPPSTAVSCLDSIVAATGNRPGAVLVSLESWPASEGEGTSGARNLHWSGERTLYLGWDELVHAQSGLRARDALEWKELWGAEAADSEFRARRWSVRAADEPVKAEPDAFSAQSIDTGAARSADGGMPGCDVALLSTPSPGRVERAVAFASRPLTTPASPLATAPAEEIRIDLAKQDLGKILSDMQWPDGTRFIVSGAGTYKCRPIEVKGHSFRIEFVQAEGLPLVIEPRAIDFRRGGKAFISVADGRIEIVDGRFKLQATTRRDIPESLLHVENGSFSLERCYLLGPMTQSAGFEALVRWRSADADRGQSAIVDSFLATDGTVVEIDGAAAPLIARNSVLATIGNVFVGRGADTIDVRQCTLSATGEFFRIDAGTGDARTSVFVDATVFAPPLEAERTSPVLLLDSGGARRTGRLQWWENANGYAEELKAFLLEAPDAADRDRQTLQSHWVGLWGEDRILRPLSGADGVRLEENYPQRTKIGPESFLLRKTSRAATWGTTGGPIGADVAALPDVERPEPRKEEAQPKRPKRARSPASPDF